MAFSKTFSTSTPAGGDPANTLHTVLTNDKAAIEERIVLEHYGFAAGNSTDSNAEAQGRHKPGYVRGVFIGAVADFPSAKSGCLAYGTDTSKLYIHNGTNWTTYTFSSSPVPTATALKAFRAKLTTATNTVASTWTTIVFNDDSATNHFDYATTFNTTTGLWTPGVAGVYLVEGRIQIASWVKITQLKLAVLVGSTKVSYSSDMNPGETATDGGMTITAIIYASATDTIGLQYHFTGSTARAISVDGTTYFAGTLLGTHT